MVTLTSSLVTPQPLTVLMSSLTSRTVQVVMSLTLVSLSKTVNSTTDAITLLDATALADHETGTNVDVEDGQMYVIGLASLDIADYDTAAEVATALGGTTGAIDAVDLDTAEGANCALIITANDLDRTLVYGYTADSTTNGYASGEFQLLADIHTATNASSGINLLVGSNLT